MYLTLEFKKFLGICQRFFKHLPFSASPLLNVAAGTKKTEKRRSRSRSRQRIESELAAKVDEIPVIHNTVEYLLSTYSLVKVWCIFFHFKQKRLKYFCYFKDYHSEHVSHTYHNHSDKGITQNVSEAKKHHSRVTQSIYFSSLEGKRY